MKSGGETAVQQASGGSNPAARALPSEGRPEPDSFTRTEANPDMQEALAQCGDSEGIPPPADEELDLSAIERTDRKPRTPAELVEAIKKENSDSKVAEIIESEVDLIIKNNSAISNFSVVFLYDFTEINRSHASAIYQSLTKAEKKKDILLILKSPGGEVEPAYLISKLCNRLKKEKFIVGIPAEAKSAATLLSLGADEIHMGAMSELGPIDPQINGYPALAFSSALEKIAQLADKYPGASEMLAKYLLGSKLEIQALGHYDRITESSTQYAIRLLESKATATAAEDDDQAIEKLASYFTNHYKDHKFVIDIEEAQKLLGSNVVFSETPIYQVCHEIHKTLELCDFAMRVNKKNKRVVAMGDKFHLLSE